MIDTKQWHHRWRIGRWQIGFRLLRHRYGYGSSDRWVLQPNVIYDRKQSGREGTVSDGGA